MKKQTQLWVKATKAHVHELGADGQFITGHGQPRRMVGKRWNAETQEFDIIPEGVFVNYHPEYIKHLKEKSLLPVNVETAILAGVTWESLDKE